MTGMCHTALWWPKGSEPRDPATTLPHTLEGRQARASADLPVAGERQAVLP